MIFFFKKRKIVLDVFTSNHNLIEAMPIERSVRFFPEWWNNLPKSYTTEDGFTPASTMKYCQGFIDYYVNSVTIPLWSDLAINITNNKNYYWQFSDRHSEAGIHSNKQYTGFLQDSNFGHLKLHSPWLLSCKEDVKWVWTQPIWGFHKPEQIIVPPAVVNFKHQSTCNINLLINLDLDKNIMLKFGQPLVHLTPMTEKKLVIKRHLISESEFQSMTYQQDTVSFTHKYKTLVNSRKRFSDCPYSK